MPETRQRKPHGGAKKGDASEDIPLAQPTREKQTEKTLIEKAEERTKELAKDQKKASASSKDRQFVQPLVNPDGTFYGVKYQDASDEEMSEFSESVLYGVALTMIFFTMELMVYSQFAEKKDWSHIIPQTFLALGFLLAFSIVLHPRSSTWWAQTIFLVGSIVAGCFLVSITSTQSHLAVMKRAPPIGTLWIWFVVEQRSDVALVGLAAVAGYYLTGGYTIFSS